jgi:hypothetical protein
MPAAARRPAAAGYRWPASHPVTPSARPGMTHREEQSMRRRIKSTHAESGVLKGWRIRSSLVTQITRFGIQDSH